MTDLEQARQLGVIQDELLARLKRLSERMDAVTSKEEIENILKEVDAITALDAALRAFFAFEVKRLAAEMRKAGVSDAEIEALINPVTERLH